MEAIGLLKQYKKRLEPQLKKYFQKKIDKARQVDPIAEEAVKMIANFTLADGKRIRPAMVYYGHLACGGKDSEKIVEASMSIELVHSFLLIHDDIIDKDDRRHGVSTLHERYKQIAKKIAPEKDVEHFGNSMAMIAGDMAASMANEIIFNAKFPPEIIIRALDKLQDIVYITIPGEMLDVIMEYRGRATEKEILRMHEGKTARYTFEGPLQLGAVLAGASERDQRRLSDYALNVGKAFQVVDDILGVFGNEKKLGKPVGSDIIEGKQTLLIIKALEKGSRSQKNILSSNLGKRDLTHGELKQVRDVIIETGSLDYSKQLASGLIRKALESLHKAPIRNDEAKVFLEGIAQYIIEREH